MVLPHFGQTVRELDTKKMVMGFTHEQTCARPCQNEDQEIKIMKVQE